MNNPFNKEKVVEHYKGFSLKAFAAKLAAFLKPDHLIYRGFLTQTGTANPTVRVIKNTIGDLEFLRYQVGIYAISGDGLLPYGKTSFWIGNNGGKRIFEISKPTEDDSVELIAWNWNGTNFVAADGALNDTPFEIRVEL